MQLFLISLISLLVLSPQIYADDQAEVMHYLVQAQQQKLAQQPTWKKLLYVTEQSSEVRSANFFISEQGQHNLTQELEANIRALLAPQQGDLAYRCRFPARSQWLQQQLGVDLAPIKCEKFDAWWAQIQPHKTTLIYATDFMGNPSSMFGHTLLRIDPKQSAQLNLVAYAVNYAATVQGEQSWSYAWKGLTGQYPGEYAIMPYYHKVKEYGDFESRDLWEYELNLTEQESQFLVKHLWEMQGVSFPYYFVSDNCAYRLLGLLELVRPRSPLQQQFQTAAIPVETIKAIQNAGLVKHVVYRPALETQLNHQIGQHGTSLAQVAQQLIQLPADEMANAVSTYSQLEQAQILEMAYDALYLQMTAGKRTGHTLQAQLRQLLKLRSQIDLAKQRQLPEQPKFDPSQGHYARQIGMSIGQLQNDSFVEIHHRQAYHDLIDPQQGFRLGTQLKVLDGSLQYRDERLKLSELNLLTVNAYSPVTPFKQHLSWGLNVGWRQEALALGQFSEQQQHGVFNLNAQAGQSYLSPAQKHLCYGQLQAHVQASKALDLGWRAGLGPTLGCQSVWSTHVNSVVQLELPFWHDAEKWHLKAKTELQYVINPQQGLRVGYAYQTQDNRDWDTFNFSFVQYF